MNLGGLWQQNTPGLTDAQWIAYLDRFPITTYTETVFYLYLEEHTMYYQPQPPPYPPQYYGPRYSGCLKFAMYALSLFIPIVGIIAGIIYMSRGDPESSALGKTCLAISIIVMILGCCAGVGAGGLSLLFGEGMMEYY
jgi:hypothetical protein